MNSMGNQAAGAVEYIKGKLERIIGKGTGDRSMQARGVGHEAKGGVRYEAGKAEGAINNLTKD